ncbi:DUF3105 domain-containing protein [Streptomyces sp. JNUCC 64]
MGSAGAKTQRNTRQARIEEMRRAEAARERRNRILTWGTSSVIVAAVAFGGWYYVDEANDREAAKERLAAQPVKGEKTWDKLGRNHVTKPVTYPMSPPVGGDHHPTWMNCDGDVYKEPIGETYAVHSLEHGAVWITHTDKAPAKDVEELAERVGKTPYTLMSPYENQKSPIVLSAWGRQLGVTSASDPRIDQFLRKYVQGPQTPEPGAACTNGVSA